MSVLDPGGIPPGSSTQEERYRGGVEVLQRALIDGCPATIDEASRAIAVNSAHLGDGAFETIGVWGGRAFRVADHLRRLCRSLEAIGLPAPDPARIAADIAAVLDGVGEVDAMLRIYGTGSGTRVVTLLDQPVRPVPHHLVPMPAPWIRPCDTYGPAGAKTMSYAPNMAATRAARAAGGDDALLLANEGWVLEGPTFAVLWVVGGILRTPALDLGIIDSITRRTLLELAEVPVEEDRWTLDELACASEIMLSSSIRGVEPVRQVGDLCVGAQTPVRDGLAAALWAARRSPG
ncbi:MAG: aminotransferase class IV [Egibacteraceae bacterium]